MKNSLKRLLSVLLVVTVVIGSAPLSGLKGFNFPDFSVLFSTKVEAIDNCKAETIEFGKNYLICLLDKETTISGTMVYSGDYPSNIDLTFSCDNSSAFVFYTPESRVTDTVNKKEIFSLRVLAQKVGDFEITVTTSDGLSDSVMINVIDNSYDQYLASTLINQKKSSIKNANMLYSYIFSEKLDTTDFLSSFVVNEDSRFTPEYYYELVLLDLLLDQSKNYNYLDSVKKNIEQTKDTIIDYAVKYNTNYTKEQLNKVRYSDLTTSEKLDYQQAFEDATSISNIWDGVNSVANGIDTVEDYFSLLAKYSELKNVNEYYIKVLDDLSIVLSYEISETALSKINEYYFLKALDNISAAFYDSNIAVADCFSKSAEDIIWRLVKEVASVVLEKIFGSASQAIEITYETSLLVANSALALSDLVVAECTIKAVNFIEHYLKEALDIEASQYNANQNDEYAKRFNCTYLLLLSCFNYGNEVHSHYSSLYYNDRFLAKIGTLFNKNSKVLYNEIIKRINECNKVIQEEYEYFTSITDQYKSKYYETSQKWAVTLNYNADISFNKTQYFYDGEEIWLTGINPKRNGYNFAGWYYDSDCTKEFSEGIIAKNNISLYAKWTANAIISTDSINVFECRLSNIAFKKTRTINNIGQADYIIPAYMDGYVLTAIDANAIPEYVSSVFVPDTITSIADGAISKNTVIYCESGSYAEQYAEDNGYQFERTILLNDSTNPTGICGDNLKWELDRNTGVLKVFGKGAMYDYGYQSPWKEYEDYIVSVEFGDGVTGVGHGAFYGLYNLKNVDINDNITEIAKYAFYNCIGLENVTIGTDVEYIGNYAFGNCTNLIKINYNARSLILSESSYSLFENAGTENTGIEVVIGDCVENIPVNLFWSYAEYQRPSDTPPNIVYVSIGKNVSFIGDGAFARCSNLNRVDFTGDKLETIDEEAFAGCTTLVHMDLPDNLKMICWRAFSGCEGLSAIEIPGSVITVGEWAFVDCIGISSITISEGVQNVERGAFSGCESLKSIILPDSIINVGNDAFADCPLETVIMGSGLNYIPKTLINDEFLKTFVIGSEVCSIHDSAFENCFGLSRILIPKSVCEIGAEAFSGCEGLTDVIFQTDSKVIKIGDYAFNNCIKLTNVTIPNSVTSIGKSAFYGCTSLGDIVIPDNVTNIGEKAFYNCGITGTIVIPENVTNIGDDAFVGNKFNKVIYNAIKCYTSYMDEYLDPDSLKYDTAYAVWDGLTVFPDCTEIIFGGNVEFIPTSLVANNNNLTSIILPENVKRIQPYAFRNCPNLSSASFCKGVSSVGFGAFDKCINLNDVYYNATECDWSKITIGAKNKELTVAVIHFIDGGHEHLWSVATKVLPSCLLQGSVTYKCSVCNDTYTEIMPSTGHTAGEWEIVTDATTEIEGEKVKKCTVCGTILETDVIPTISVLTGYCGENVTWKLNLETGVLEISGEGDMYDYKNWSDNAPWYNNRSVIKTVIIKDGVTSIGEYAFDNCEELTSLKISDSVAIIANSAFMYCYSLISVTIPDGVISIGDHVFRYCTSLTSVEIGDSVTSIGDYTFCDCENLTEISIPDSVTSIGKSVFSGCENLETAVIGNGITNISSYAFEYCISLKLVIIPDSVEGIGEYAFYACSALESITIPKNLRSIGVLAFSGCTSLRNIWVVEENSAYSSDSNGILYNKNKTEIIIYPAGKVETSFEIPRFVESIGDFAFNKCNNLTTIVITDNVTSIGTEAFSSCTALTSVTIPDTITSISDSAFKHCTALTAIAIPDSVTIIGDFAFYGCTNLTSVTIPDNVTSIGYGAFSYCENLTTVIIGNGVTSIGACAFESCTNLKTVLLGDSITSIGNDAFQYCINLESITIPESVISIGSYAFETCTSLKSIEIPDSVTNVGFAAFRNCTNLTSVTIGKNVKTFGDYTFYKCTNLEDVYYTGDINSWCNITFAELYNDGYSSPLYYAKNFYINGVLQEDIIIPDTVSVINGSAFAGYDRLKSITIPDSVTSIGSYSFYDCTNLKSIIIPDSVKSIGDYAFYDCTNLESITIPDSVKSIGDYAFYNCTNLKSITIPDSVTSIGYNAFTDTAYYNNSENWESDVLYINNHLIEANENLSGEYSIKSGTKTIADYAFDDCKNLISVTLTDSVTNIGEYAFYNCKGITSIVIPDGVTSIGDGTFKNCYQLSVVAIPNSVITIGGGVFNGCRNLKFIELPDSIISIGYNAFTDTAYYNNSENWENSVLYIGKYLIEADESLTGEYSIKDGTKVIVRYAFEDCENLSSVIIPDSVINIDQGAFSSCLSLMSVTIPYGVTSIGAMAFNNCINLNSVIIPSSVTNIGYYAFGNCTNLTDVYFMGTEKEWSKITIDIDNKNLFSATIHFTGDGHKHFYTSSITKEPTCIDEGVKTYICFCGDSYNEKVTALGHSYDSVVTPPTCTERGYTTYTCSACEDNYVDDFVSATGHKYSAWEVTTEPTMTEKGKKVSTCSVCKTTKEKDIPATGITVTLTDSDDNIICNQVIDGNSTEYNFEGIEDGEYTVTVSRETYVSRGYTITVTGGYASCEFELNHVGDINGDSNVTVLDYTKLLRHVKKTSALDGYAFDCADVNGDGKLTVLDYTKLLRHVKKIEMLW